MFISKKLLLFTTGGLALLVFWFIYTNINTTYLTISPYPNGKNFAFSITDDTDGVKLEKIKPIYDFLYSLGLRTTITCWIFKPTDLSCMPDPEDQSASDTLESPNFLNYLRNLRQKHFEIALHTATAGHDKREITENAYRIFKTCFGDYPEINIMHSKNKENIYWGNRVFDYKPLVFFLSFIIKDQYSGEDTNSAYFWGDICKDKTKYVRLWGTNSINTLKFNPSMPYHDPLKPFVNYWFSFSDGYNATFFNKLLSKKNVDILVKERGTCIVYTHFAGGFCSIDIDGKYALNDKTKSLLKYLAQQKEGWFVPTSEILNRLLFIKNFIISKNNKKIYITNKNLKLVEGVTLLSNPNLVYFNHFGKKLSANYEGEIILGDFAPQETKIIYINNSLKIKNSPKYPGFIENFSLILGRIRIYLLSHRG